MTQIRLLTLRGLFDFHKAIKNFSDERKESTWNFENSGLTPYTRIMPQSLTKDSRSLGNYEGILKEGMQFHQIVQ